MIRMLPGREVFRLMDTHGVPLEVLRDWMVDAGFTHLDAVGFGQAALDSGNYTVETLLVRLREL